MAQYTFTNKLTLRIHFLLRTKYFNEFHEVAVKNTLANETSSTVEEQEVESEFGRRRRREGELLCLMVAA